MTEEQHRRWDVAIKLIGIVGVIATSVVGLYQFHDIRDREIIQFEDLKNRELLQFADSKEREFYSEFWNQRLRLYIATLDKASAISKAESEDEVKEAITAFRLLFDGSMSVVQDPVVDRAMHQFEEKVRNVENGAMKPNELGILSYKLGRTCYESLRDSWDRPFSASKRSAGVTDSAEIDGREMSAVK